MKRRQKGEISVTNFANGINSLNPFSAVPLLHPVQSYRVKVLITQLYSSKLNDSRIDRRKFNSRAGCHMNLMISVMAIHFHVHYNPMYLPINYVNYYKLT